jgi:hypothetical protein
VVSVLKQLHHARQDFGRVLQIGIHHHDGVALREVQAGGNGCLMAKIPAETDDFNALVRQASQVDDLERSVCAAVVYKNDFPVQLLQCVAKAPEKQG